MCSMCAHYLPAALPSLMSAQLENGIVVERHVAEIAHDFREWRAVNSERQQNRHEVIVAIGWEFLYVLSRRGVADVLQD